MALAGALRLQISSPYREPLMGVGEAQGNGPHPGQEGLLYMEQCCHLLATGNSQAEIGISRLLRPEKGPQGALQVPLRSPGCPEGPLCESHTARHPGPRPSSGTPSPSSTPGGLGTRPSSGFTQTLSWFSSALVSRLHVTQGMWLGSGRAGFFRLGTNHLVVQTAALSTPSF